MVHHKKLFLCGFRFITKASWNQFWVPPPKFENKVNFAQWRYSNQWSNREVLLLLVENYTQYPALTGWNTLVWGNFWRLLRKQITPDSIFLKSNRQETSRSPPLQCFPWNWMRPQTSLIYIMTCSSISSGSSLQGVYKFKCPCRCVSGVVISVNTMSLKAQARLQ